MSPLVLVLTLLTCHLQAVPEDAVSQRLGSHLRENWAMLEGENSVRSVMKIRQQEAKGLHSQSRCRLVNVLTGRCAAAGSMRSN